MTRLEQLDTTKSGSVRKSDAMQWLEGLGEPDEQELLDSVGIKPNGFSGSTFATPISNVRVTGTPRFVESFAKFLDAFLAFESSATRLELNAQRIEDRDSGELTDNYALYLSVAQRGTDAALASAMLDQYPDRDDALRAAFDD